MIKRIPLLWRLERWINKKEAEKIAEENPGYADYFNKRAWSTCNNCGNHKFFKRKGNMKCTKCGEKKRIS